jgi:hypothetical protein
VIVRLLLWSLFDSKTTIDELRVHLPEIDPPSYWLWDAASERFGLVAFESLIDEIAVVSHLIGADPVVGEEFETL